MVLCLGGLPNPHPSTPQNGRLNLKTRETLSHCFPFSLIVRKIDQAKSIRLFCTKGIKDAAGVIAASVIDEEKPDTCLLGHKVTISFLGKALFFVVTWHDDYSFRWRHDLTARVDPGSCLPSAPYPPFRGD